VKRQRKRVTLKTKLASMIVTHLKHVDKDGNIVPIISHEDAKKLTEDQVLSLANFDHVIHHSIGGPDTHWNLVARPILEHREKTAKVDTPQIAKTKRITAKEHAFRDKLLRKKGQGEVDLDDQSSHNPTRKQWPGGRKLQSRPFPKRRGA
jgi:hypothetical protein